MLTVLTCVTAEHDLRLLLVAALVCALGAWITVELLIRAGEDRGARGFWPYLAGVAFGCSIWSTHFIAMLAYLPGAGATYEPYATAFSLIIAITVSTAGFLLRVMLPSQLGGAISGAVVGVGVAAMHYTGMLALNAAGILNWDPELVIASLVIGPMFGAFAGVAALRGKSLLATLAFVLAICAHHFTGMAALTLHPFAPDPQAHSLIESAPLALGVAGATLLILAAGVLAFWLDRRAARKSRRRLRQLADAALEGLLIVENGRLSSWNRSFEKLSGYPRESRIDLALEDVIITLGPAERSRIGAQHVLHTASDEMIPIEVISTAGSEEQLIFAVRDLRERIAADERIHFLAHFDVLTKLPNRVAFIDHLNGALLRAPASGGELAVLALDLDRFKEVNDVFGHAMGDAVLGEVATRMKSVLRENEFLARIGGDEFVAVQIGARQPEDATAFCDRLIEAATGNIEIDDNTIQLGVSIGVSIHPKDGESASELMANADLAMYRAKEGVSSGACFFSSEMDDRVRLRRALARDLREAISRNELQLFYQVQTSLSNSEVVGYEVLLRWNHPERGVINPSEFIPVAEETGSIIPIGNWVIQNACRDAALWPEPYRVAVNVSGVQFGQGDLPSVVQAALIESGLPPHRLELEITESVLISDMERALGVLRKLKSLGVTIAMDDFGTGYSSLSTLKSFPFDKIKIDRSFIDQVETHSQARSIVRAILALGRSLEIPVLAEGVETEGHLEFLRQEGCDEAQGYLLGRPRPLLGIAALTPETSAAAAG